MVEIKVPTVGESISEVTLLKWVKNDGEYVDRDEVIAELESEKATFEVNAEKAGVLKTNAKEGDTLKIGDQLAVIDDAAAKPTNGKPQPEAKKESAQKIETEKPVVIPPEQKQPSTAPVASVSNDVKATPVAAAMIAEKKVDPKSIQPSGFNGRIMKQDVVEALSHPGKYVQQQLFGRNEKREKMSQLRKTIARRLVEAKNSTAMLTTFNEADMSRIMEIRSKFKDKFKEAHGVGLGFMSFFCESLLHCIAGMACGECIYRWRLFGVS
jgi:2-oxoglutarate dehydrogenase E2 component (dihydrolipoamide succinyltransferase)